MPVSTATIDVSTRGMTDVHDLTGEVARAVGDSGLASGTVTVFAPGSTAGITWHDDNGAAHVRAARVGPSVTVPFVNGALTLGTWQQIVLICFDTRPRQRSIVVQVVGE